MGTRSTKSSHNKKSRNRPAVVEKSSPEETPAELSESAWRISAIAIFIIGAVLRLYDLDLVPLHHDEGVNGNFLVRLVREHIYRYDPANYHGPTLYYFAGIIPWIIKLLFGADARDTYGLTTFNIRLVTVVFGLGTIALIYLLRKRLGTIATLAAALFVAISPGAIYLSRYFIHETQFVFFTLGIVVAALRFYDDRKPYYIVLAFSSAALLFATKETAMISVGVLLIAFVLTQIYMRVMNRPKGHAKSRTRERFTELVDASGGSMALILWVVLALVVFVVINVVFYSSFFDNYPKGVYDSLKTFEIWYKTGKAAHVHPPTTYFTWLFSQESAVLLLGTIGAAIAVLKPKNSFALFCGMWAFGLIAAYSLIAYKTPWLILNFVVPLAIVAGYAIEAIYRMDSNRLRFPIAVMALAVIVGAYQTIDLNFFNYDNDATYYVYVYAHTKRDTIKLVEEVEKLAQQNPQKKQTGITIVSPDYWPLPWYLRNYSRVGYFARMTQSSEPIIIASESQRAEMDTNFGELYQLVPSGASDEGYELRPGVNLLLYKRKTMLAGQP